MNLDEATLAWLSDHIVGALARDERVGAAALLFLLRRFNAGACADLAEPLGAALARTFDDQAQRGPDDDGAVWIAVFSEAAAISDDPRLPRAAADLLARLHRGSHHSVEDAMRAVEASLVSVNVPEARELVAETIDELERIIARAYRPGQGVSHDIEGATFVRGGLGDQVRSASALLTAYAITGRLPYAMLADELMQGVLRTTLNECDVSFALNCETARVFCNLAALQQDDGYRRAAVLAIDSDYVRDATRSLSSLAPSVREKGVEAAPFGLALAEWLKVR